MQSRSVALLVLASVAGCEDNAGIRIAPQLLTSVDLIGARPRAADGTAACGGDPSRLDVDLVLGSDLDRLVEAGSRIQVVRGDAVENVDVAPDAVRIELSAGMATPEGGGAAAPVGLRGGPVAWVAAGSPLRLGLVVDATASAGQGDPSGLRLDAARGMVEQVLCAASGAHGCPFSAGTRVAMYALRDGGLMPVVGVSRELGLGANLEQLGRGIDAIRGVQSSGTVPLIDVLVNRVAPDMIASAAPEGGQAAIALLTAQGIDTGSQRVPSNLPADAPVFVVAEATNPELESIACASGGGLAIVGDATAFERGARLARYALRGRWRVPVEADVSALSPERYRVDAHVVARIGDASVESDVSFPMEVLNP